VLLFTVRAWKLVRFFHRGNGSIAVHENAYETVQKPQENVYCGKYVENENYEFIFLS